MTVVSEITQDKPLCVDLDGTLVATDTLWESLLRLLLRNPFMIFSVIRWVLNGKATLKCEVSKHVKTDPAQWPFRPEILEWLKAEKSRGRHILLVTGAPGQVANSVADHLGIFDGVFHTSEAINLTSLRKRDLLVEHFGEKGFDYLGDSNDDIPVFEAAHNVYLVRPHGSVGRWLKNNSQAEVLLEYGNAFRTALKAMRVHQWLKNTLLFVPIVLQHEYFELLYALDGIIGFFSFSFAASSVYILNDLVDLRNDRRHSTKRFRPIASGQLEIPNAIMLAGGLLVVSLALSLLLPPVFLLVLAVYLVATTVYSFFLKRKLLVDVFTLAGLFTLRIIAGAAAVGASLSFWLLAFSIFFFLSLALVKRYVELQELDSSEGSKKVGRGYYAVDFEMIGQAGISSAFAAALVLALYIHSEETREIYQSPLFLWPLCPLILYMLLRIWMLARREQMHDDPVVFIIRDWRSQLVTATGALLMALAVAFPT
ncbi:UbiA family prenyltransferase [Hoeflea sp. WL0058]|uniref:UbiA family prenyltransferase n=1 Tax=Flavimaribacter sediminis TaxID=2865987 RepID=A0AAE2ZG77_9HYPH|nr:UbiA family prenyltransferase [Flavimaribacter sediminis]MBW8635959.1 UbiA family prenyltransferase [Flavimaribacter sediminis]